MTFVEHLALVWDRRVSASLGTSVFNISSLGNRTTTGTGDNRQGKLNYLLEVEETDEVHKIYQKFAKVTVSTASNINNLGKGFPALWMYRKKLR